MCVCEVALGKQAKTDKADVGGGGGGGGTLALPPHTRREGLDTDDRD